MPLQKPLCATRFASSCHPHHCSMCAVVTWSYLPLWAGPEEFSLHASHFLGAGSKVWVQAVWVNQQPNLLVARLFTVWIAVSFAVSVTWFPLITWAFELLLYKSYCGVRNCPLLLLVASQVPVLHLVITGFVWNGLLREHLCSWIRTRSKAV